MDFCEVADLAALARDDRFATNRGRVTNYDALKPLIVERLRTEPRHYWIERLTAAGVPCGSVRDLHEVFNDSQLQARDMIAAVEHATAGTLRLLGVPIKLSDTSGVVRCAPPALGQHTEAVLQRDLGLNGTDISRLRSLGVI